MAVYTENFAGHTVDAPPAGWTERWDASGGASWTVTAVPDAEGGKTVRYANSVDANSLLTWDAVDGDANRADAEILGRFRLNYATIANYRNTPGVAVRASGSAATATAYVAYWSPYNGGVLYLGRFLNGAWQQLGYIDLDDSSLLGITTATWFYLRLRANGDSIRAKAWRESLIEPADWQISVTDSQIAGAGAVGLFGYKSGAYTADCDLVSVGTAGEAAPLTPTTVEERLTQEVIEVALAPDPDARLSQEVIEVALAPDPDARLTQMVIEVLVANAPPGGNYVIVNVIT